MNIRNVLSIYDNDEDKWFTCIHPFIMHSQYSGCQNGQFLRSNWFKQKLDLKQPLLCRVTRYILNYEDKNFYFMFSENVIQSCINNNKKKLCKMNKNANLIFDLVSHKINKKINYYITLPVIEYTNLN